MTDINTVETALATDLLAALGSLRRALRRRVGHAAGVSKLTDAQRDVVRAVRLHPGSRVGDVAQMLHLAPNTVSTLAGGLVAAGWLERQPDEEDARSARLTLSSTGKTSVAEWRDRRATVLTEQLGKLTLAERRAIEAAVPAIQALVESLQ